MPALSTELIGLRLWQDDARERIANDAAHIAAQDALLLEQNAALTACSEALHRAQCAINAYIERKREYVPRKKRSRPGACMRSSSEHSADLRT